MAIEMQTLLEARARHLLAGDFAAYAAHFLTPLPLFLPDQTVTFTTQSQLIHFARGLLDSFLERGIVAWRPMIMAQELPRGDRQRLWVRWDEITADGSISVSSDCLNYLRKTPQGLRTEMIQWQNLAVQQSCYALQARLKSA